MMMEKRVALITGGTRGIGFGVACEMAKSGFNLAVNGVKAKTEVKEALKKLKELGAEAGMFAKHLEACIYW